MNVKSKMPCSSFKPYYSDYNIAMVYWIKCGDRRDDSPNGSDFNVQLSNNKKVLGINRVVRFKVKPNFEPLIKKIYEKYGKPDIELKHKTTNDNTYRTGYYIEMCWGIDCGIGRESYNRGELTHPSFKHLRMVVSDFDYNKKYGNDFSISFSLRDPVEEKRNGKRNIKLNKEHEDRIRRSESDINL